MPETRPPQAEVPALNLCEMVLSKPFDTTFGDRSIGLKVGIAGLDPRMRDANALLSATAVELRHAQTEGNGPISVAEPERVRVSLPRSSKIH